MPRIKPSIDTTKYNKLQDLLWCAYKRSNKKSEEVGKALDVSGNQVHIYLRKPENMKIDKLLKFARNLNIPIDELREALRY